MRGSGAGPLPRIGISETAAPTAMIVPVPTNALKDRLRLAAQAEGFALFGVAPAQPLEEDLDRLVAWLASGQAGPLAAWMADRPERRARPELLLPGARSVVMLGMAYGQEPADPSLLSGRSEGRVSRHAQGVDYHRVVGLRVRRLADWLDAEAGETAEAGGAPGSSLAFVDTGPLLERAFAVRAGLGFIGRNNCLIHPRHGSWFFLAGIVTRVTLPPDAPLHEAGCGECRRCLDACPTGALRAPHELDARRCLACLTVETRDPFEPSVAAHLENRLFGCDTCQEVCPYNAEALPCTEPSLRAIPTNPTKSAASESSPAKTAGTLLDGATATLEAILRIRSNREFERLLGASGMARARRRGLRRNAAAVAVHLGRTDLAPLMDPMASDAPTRPEPE